MTCCEFLSGTLDEPMQVVKLNIWLRTSWTECRLRWNTSDYSGIDSVVIPSEWLWIPDLTLYDSATVGVLTDDGKRR
ncbi:hypothetical protein ScPMuIL_018122 [Solemya velum]